MSRQALGTRARAHTHSTLLTTMAYLGGGRERDCKTNSCRRGSEFTVMPQADA